MAQSNWTFQEDSYTYKRPWATFYLIHLPPIYFWPLATNVCEGILDETYLSTVFLPETCVAFSSYERVGLYTCATCNVSNNLTGPIVLVTTFFERFIQSTFLAKWKVVAQNFPLFQLWTPRRTCNEAGKYFETLDRTRTYKIKRWMSSVGEKGVRGSERIGGTTVW